MAKRLIILLLCVFAFGQDYGQWRWSSQPIMQMPDASALHSVASGYMAHCFEHRLEWYQADLISFGIGLAWEVKDALVPYEKAGLIGGEGFSVGDIQMNVLGILLNRAGTHFFISKNMIHFTWSF